jgi:preprotein translocase subunit SecF
MMRRMRRGDFHLNILGRARMWFVVSGVIVLISIASLAVRQVNAGLEFRGGTAFEAQATSTRVSVKDVRSALAGAGIAEATVQKLGDRGFRAETAHLDPKVQDRAIAAIAKATGARNDDVNVQDVGPKWGRQITNKAVLSLFIFLGVVIVYMSIRLEPKMAGAAILALVHDLVITAGIYSLTGFVVTPATIIALLTVLGYSLYDTVVIFDRVKVRSASLSAAGNVTYTDAANQSINQVLMRSLNTSITGLLPVGSLLFVGSFLLGAQTLRELALALFIGLTAGAYSSIFLATPVLAIWKEREPRWTTLRTRVAARGADAVPRPPAIPPPPASAPAPVARPSDVATAVAEPPPAESRPPAQVGTGTTPRPRRRKKRKRRKR